MATLKDIISDIKSLSKSDFDKLLSLLTGSPVHTVVSLESFVAKERFNAGRVCPHCGSVHVRRNGKRKDGVQKYSCADCNKHFIATTNSIVQGTKKDVSIWMKYIDCMLKDMTLKDSADTCGISIRTTFTWRHKILDVMRVMEDSVTLDGIVEADETFYDISYKGNHKKDGFILPRRAHKRGGESTKRGLSRDKVCIPCAVNRNGLSIAKAACLGKVSLKAIEGVLGSRISKDSVVCTDKEASYRRFALNESITLKQLKAEPGKKVSVKGIYHIQHINSYHSMLSAFIMRHKGVSTKYINNYLAWHNFMNYSKECREEKKTIMMTFVMTQYMSIRAREVSSREVLPLVA